MCVRKGKIIFKFSLVFQVISIKSKISQTSDIISYYQICNPEFQQPGNQTGKRNFSMLLAGM